MDIKKIYITSEIGQAALLCNGYELKGLDKENPNKVRFILIVRKGLIVQ